MPLSSDPDARSRQLANLRPGSGAPVGNGRAVRHGAYAAVTEAELSGKVRELVEALGADLPVRERDGGVPAADGLALRLLAENRVRRARVAESELRHGIEAPDGKLRGIVEFGLRLDREARALAVELGMTPRSRAALGLDLVRAQSASEQLADLAAAGRRTRHGADVEATAEDDDGGARG